MRLICTSQEGSPAIEEQDGVVAMEATNEIRNCTVNFQCPKLWQRLAQTENSKVRFCDYCFEQVHLVETEKELAEQSALGRCVAILNLSPSHKAYDGKGLMGEIVADWSPSISTRKRTKKRAETCRMQMRIHKTSFRTA